MRCVYFAEFSDGFGYVGVTDNYERRLKEHCFGSSKSEVKEHMRHTNLIPKFTRLTEYISDEEANRLEMEYTITYMSQGLRMLNKQEPGRASTRPINKESEADISTVVLPQNDCYIPECLTRFSGKTPYYAMKFIVVLLIHLSKSCERVVKFRLKELGINPHEYGKLKNTISQLLKLKHNGFFLFEDVVIPWHYSNGAMAYKRKEGYVEMRISKEVFALIDRICLDEKEFNALLKVESSNALRLYNILRNRKFARFTYDALREALGLESQYPNPANLKQRVLTPFVERISASGLPMRNIDFKYEYKLGLCGPELEYVTFSY